MLAINLDIGNVVLKDGGDVDLLKKNNLSVQCHRAMVVLLSEDAMDVRDDINERRGRSRSKLNDAPLFRYDVDASWRKREGKLTTTTRRVLFSYLGEGSLGEDAAVGISMVDEMVFVLVVVDLHQQASFTTGTVTDDDQLSADLSHGWGIDVWIRGKERKRALHSRLFREYARKVKKEGKELDEGFGRWVWVVDFSLP